MDALWQLLPSNPARSSSLPAADAPVSTHGASDGIGKLPTELLLEILNQLAHEDIMRCAVTSRQLRAVAQAHGEYYITARIELDSQYKMEEPHLAHLSDLIQRRLPLYLRIKIIPVGDSWLMWLVERRRAALLSAISAALVVKMRVIAHGWNLADITRTLLVHTAGPRLHELSMSTWESQAPSPDALRDALAVCTSLRALELRGIPLPPHPIAALSAVERATTTHPDAAGWAGLAALCASLPAVHTLHVVFYEDPEQSRALGAATALPQRIQYVTFSLDAKIRDNEWLCGQLQLLTVHCASVEVRSIRLYAIDSEERQHLFHSLINAYFFDTLSALRVGIAWTPDAIPNLIITLSRMHAAPQQRLTIVTARQKSPHIQNPDWAYKPLAAYVSRLRALTIDAESLDVFVDLVLLLDLEEIRVEVSSSGPPAITRVHKYRVDSARRIVEPFLYGGEGPDGIAQPVLVFGVPFGEPPAQVTLSYIAAVAAQLKLVSRSRAARYVLDRVWVIEDA
jgi:hypothetical protein